MDRSSMAFSSEASCNFSQSQILAQIFEFFELRNFFRSRKVARFITVKLSGDLNSIFPSIYRVSQNNFTDAAADASEGLWLR